MIRPLRWTTGMLLAAGLLLGTLRAEEGAAPVKNGTPARPVVHAGLASATDAAAKDGALVLLVFEADWSADCREFDTKTMASPAFTGKAGRLHIVYIDVQAAPKTAAAFKVSKIPDLVLLTTDMKIIARVQGALSPEELLKWIEQGRRRTARGMWEGNALDDETGGSGTAPSGPEEFKQLVKALGDGDPVSRQRAAKVLEAERGRAMPYLIDGLDDPYLGVRIGSAEVVRRLAPAAPAPDPWEPVETRRRQAAQLRQWWDKTGELPLAPPRRPLDPEEARSAEEALESVLQEDALRRTWGMSVLVRLGPAVLPAVREAIRKSSATGHQRTLWVLEDVRWAILIPDRVELRVRARRDLARGTSEERQAATLRLGGCRTGALGALRELIDDADPLVRESAVHALTRLGGGDALAATAVLLKAKDTNLRMVAAQALGRSKDPRAAPYLVTAVDDPDEVVACVAIAALEEIKAKDQQAVLVSCLKDKRWRVRAAAAEVIGKLELADANDALLRLLGDEDPFVVKNALTALRSTEGVPDLETLRAVIRRMPGLTGLAIECTVGSRSTAVLKTVEALYDESDAERRRGILRGLAESGYGRAGGDWNAFFTKTVASKDPVVRRRLVDVLARSSVPTATPFVARLLEDEDMEVRVATAGLAVRAAAYHRGVSGDQGELDYGILNLLDAKTPGAEATTEEPPSSGGLLARLINRLRGRQERVGAPVGDGRRLKRARELRQLYDRWHAALKDTLDKRQDLTVGVAFYVTGDATSGLPVLARMFRRKDLKEELPKMSYVVMTLILKCLPWPEGKEVVEPARRSSFLYGRMLNSLEHASKGLVTYPTHPDRIVAGVETAQGDEFERIAGILTTRRERGGASLYAGTRSTEEVLKRLRVSKVAGARALGVFVTGTRGTANLLRPSGAPDAQFAIVEKALRDENPWVRRAAISGVVAHLTDQVKRERKLAPFLTDPHPAVATMAAAGILTGELRSAAQLSSCQYFRFEDTQVWVSDGIISSMSYRQGVVLATIDRKPVFLDVVRKRLAEDRPGESEEDAQLTAAFTLLLAQYGDFSALDRKLAAWNHNRDPEVPRMLLIGLALSRDARYLPPLREALEKQQSEWEVREMLKWLQGIRGKEARELRREINRRIRAASSIF